MCEFPKSVIDAVFNGYFASGCPLHFLDNIRRNHQAFDPLLSNRVCDGA